jgi:hypothetical protein
MLLAQKMVIPRIMTHCMLHVRHNLNPANVVPWLIWADEHTGFADLRGTAFSYLVSHFREVRRTRETLVLLQQKRPDILMDLIMAL